MTRRITVALGTLVCVLQLAALMSAQPQSQRPPQPSGAPAATPSRVIALTAFSHTVSDVDRAVAFYRQVFALESFGPVPRPARDSAMQELTNTPGAKYREA